MASGPSKSVAVLPWAFRNALFGGFSRTMRQLLQNGILGAGAYLVLQNEMTAGMIFASSIISGRALQPRVRPGEPPAVDDRHQERDNHRRQHGQLDGERAALATQAGRAPRPSPALARTPGHLSSHLAV